MTTSKPRLVYLAAPYSHPDPGVVARRMEEFRQSYMALINKGVIVFSPLVHHFMLNGQTPGTWEFWEGYSKALLDRCDEMRVLMLDGWRDSNGVAAEIVYAEQHHIPILYIGKVL